MKKILSGLLVALPGILLAQSDVDVLRYSENTFGGTARSTSMGGAFGAAGGDFSTLSTNPAGIAIYKKSELTLSPSLYMNNSSASYFGKSLDNQKSNFNFSNAGFVYSYNTEKSDWYNVNFGIGYNRMNNYNNSFTYQGTNPYSSLMDNYLDRLTPGAVPADNTDLRLAYNTYLVNPDNQGNYTTYVPKGNISQSQHTITTGAQGETAISMGANYMDRLYIGGTLGFPSIRFHDKTSYTESDLGTSAYFKSFTNSQDITTTGSGFNLKFGAIFRAADWVRLGLSYSTPSFYDMHDDYTFSTTSNFKKPVPESKTVTDSTTTSFNSEFAGSFDYQLITPSRTLASISFILNPGETSPKALKALLNFDIERVNYASARLNSDQDAFSDVNDAVNQKYRDAFNYRSGLEVRVNQIFTVRGGYAYYSSPFKAEFETVKADKSYITGGFGIRGSGYFIDFAYITSASKDFVLPYSANGLPAAGSTITNNTDRYVLTLGLRF